MKYRNLPKLTFKNTKGIEYLIVWKAPAKKYRADGLCDPPDSKSPEVWVDPSLDEKLFLDVLIEEIFHAHAFEKSEKEARKFAANLRRVLIKCGFRMA